MIFRSHRTKLPSLTALRFFEAAARHENLVRAAHELHITHGAISKQISALEHDLGGQLFERRNRRIFLTPRGKRLAERLNCLFRDLEEIWAEAKMTSNERPLVLSCEPTLCLKLLIHWIPTLHRELDMEVRVLAGGGQIDFRRDHINLAIRRNDFPTDLLHSHFLADEFMAPVVASHSTDTLSALRDGTAVLLHTQTRPKAWALWADRTNTELSPKQDVVYEHFYLALEAAIAGQGVALASIHMVLPDIRSGRLRALCEFTPDGTHYVMLSEEPFNKDARNLPLMDWIGKRLQSNTEDLKVSTVR